MSSLAESIRGTVARLIEPDSVELEVIEHRPAEPTDRPPIVFVHGLAHAAWCWEEYWMPDLAERGWRSLALSLRGHGSSSGRERRDWATLAHYARDVRDVIAQLDEPPIVVGHSMGAVVSMRVLEATPARAGVLVAPVAADTGLRMAASIAVDTPGEFLEALLFGKPMDLRKDRLFCDALDDSRAHEFIERLERPTALNQYQLMLPRRTRTSTAPMLVMGAYDDALVPPGDVLRTSDVYSAPLRMFHGIGHDMMLDRDWQLPLDAMERWLLDQLEQ